MQDLRDKLLKAGLVDKKQARTVKTDKRKARKRKGKHRLDQAVQQEQSERHKQRQQELARAAREEQDRRNAQAKLRDKQEQIRNIIRRAALAKIHGEGRPFYFVGLDKRIRRLYPLPEIAEQLGSGKLAIVSLDEPGGPDYAVVDLACVRRLEALAPEVILFWNKPGQQGDLPTYGSGQ